jgi:hypothetical protein
MKLSKFVMWTYFHGKHVDLVWYGRNEIRRRIEGVWGIVIIFHFALIYLFFLKV